MVKDPQESGAVANADCQHMLPRGAACACCRGSRCCRWRAPRQPHKQLHDCGAIWPGIQGAPCQLGAARPQLLWCERTGRQGL